MIYLGLKDNVKYMEIVLENIPNHVILYILSVNSDKLFCFFL